MKQYINGYMYLKDVYGHEEEIEEYLDVYQSLIAKITEWLEINVFRDIIRNYKSFCRKYFNIKILHRDFLKNKYNILAYIIHSDIKLGTYKV